MLTRAVRLGDDIDDFCVKCKRVMNHAVVSILKDAPAKVRCRTCHSDHDFRNEQPPPPKVDPRKAALFNQVLGNVGGLPAEAAVGAGAGAAEGDVDDTPAEPETEADEVEVKAETKSKKVKSKAAAKTAKKSK